MYDHIPMSRIRRRREERMRAVQQAVQAVEEDERFREAVAFIRGVEAIEPRERVAALGRVTTLTQKRDGNLDRQIEAIRKAVQEHGGKVKVLFRKAGVGG